MQVKITRTMPDVRCECGEMFDASMTRVCAKCVRKAAVVFWATMGTTVPGPAAETGEGR